MSMNSPSAAETETLVVPPAAHLSWNADSTMTPRKRNPDMRLVVWLVALCLTSCLWAVWATFVIIDLGGSMDIEHSFDFQKRIHFTASPTVNQDHYERMKEIGTASNYECALQGTFASCQSVDDGSVIEIWFTPKGPLYVREKQSKDHFRLVERSWPFGTLRMQY